MMTLAEIKNNTIWVAKMMGYRTTGTYEEIGYLQEDEDCRDFDICCKQPTEELQQFWDACWKYEETHRCWMTIDEFYAIWEADESVRALGIPQKKNIRPVIGKLSEYLENYSNKENVLVEGSGNHYAMSYRDALQMMGRDFDVVEVGEKYDAHYFVLQCYDDDLRQLSYMSNSAAISNSYLGVIGW